MGKRARHYFGYSTNVHRSENLREIYRFLKDYTLPIKRRIFGRENGGLELRLGIGTARELAPAGKREEFRAFLEDNGLEIFSINAFPLNDFQARHVKETVYAPSWEEKERVVWTRRICEIFADLLPEDRPGSVSTLGGTYRFWSHGERSLRRMAANYLAVLETLEKIEETRGKNIVLAAEPEPDTTFEIASDVIRFVEDYLVPEARARWKKRYRSAAAIEEAVRRRFTVNLDTCHFSVLFQDPSRALTELTRAGISIGKLHVTSALKLGNPHRAKRSYQTFRGMHEPRFLHQFCGADARGRVLWRGRDLDELPRELRRGERPELAELRTHFHVPLNLKHWKSLSTTREETERALRKTVRQGLCSHLVLETYTWPVLGTSDRLVDGIAREFRWLVKTADQPNARE